MLPHISGDGARCARVERLERRRTGERKASRNVERVDQCRRGARGKSDAGETGAAHEASCGVASVYSEKEDEAVRGEVVVAGLRSEDGTG